MPHLSSSTLRLIVYALVISGSFYLGIIIYPNFSAKPTEITASSVKVFSSYLEKASKNDLTLLDGNSKFTVKSSQIQSWLEPYIRSYTGSKDIRLSYANIENYLQTLSSKLNTDPVDAKLSFKNNRAEIFVPSVKGRRLNLQASISSVSNALLEDRPSASLDFDNIEPNITLDKINDLGIETLLGRGESDYGKSSSARIHNIKIGMSKFNGALLKPGEEFSFNSLLGDVDESQDYQAELVIKDGKLVKEYGGGLCQVATTMFRAAILSGLDITERKPHSFPVQYYNPQGFDATIYPGVVDLKFVNNTNNHVLIQTKLAGSKLVVEIYGKNPGHEVKIEGPVQYSKQSGGAMKAYFVRKIYSGEQLTKEERFDSVYKAPPAHPEEKNPYE